MCTVKYKDEDNTSVMTNIKCGLTSECPVSTPALCSRPMSIGL